MTRDLDMMRRAARLGMRGIGRVEPNPLVGCVIVGPDGRIIGEGRHARYGEAHAEVAAIADCRRRGAEPRGATMYVTLEPCAHDGKTPPCTQALIDAGIRRCVIGRLDPSAAGSGADILRHAGIEVEFLECPEAIRLTDSFIKRSTTGLPWVIVKWAQTLDGCIATRSSQSRWVSNTISRAAVHRLRARVDAIMTGVGTVLADDPMLTARKVRRVSRLARRIVIDPDLVTPLHCKLVQTAGEAPTIIATDASTRAGHAEQVGYYEEAGVEVVEIAPGPNGLTDLLARLVESHGLSRILVEAGGGLAGQLLRQNLVDELLVYVAPRLLGDEEGIPPVRGFQPATMTESLPLTLRRMRRLGDDVELLYRRG